MSIDFNHNPHSSTFDLTQTQIVDGKLVRVLAWYDNEWGFSNRMADTAVPWASCSSPAADTRFFASQLLAGAAGPGSARTSDRRGP